MGMIIWGVALIAAGVAILLGISLWPIIFIGLGSVFLIRGLLRRGRRDQHARWDWRREFGPPSRRGRSDQSDDDD